MMDARLVCATTDDVAVQYHALVSHSDVCSCVPKRLQGCELALSGPVEMVPVGLC